MEVDLNKPRVTEKKGKVINYKEVKDFNKLLKTSIKYEIGSPFICFFDNKIF